MTQEACDVLLLLAPSVRLLDWLEKMLAQMERKGEEVPKKDAEYLKRWRKIYSDQPAEETDYVPSSVWAEIGERMPG